MGMRDNAISLFEEQRALTNDEMRAYKDMLRKKEKNMGIYVKGNPKEGDYKLIKTTDGFVLEGKDIAYACVEVDDELFKKAESVYVLQQIRNR